MDSLSALSAFVHAAEMGSFTLAARKLGLSSSAIGKAIARLESRMSVRLFHRSTRSVALTQEGELLLESCRKIVVELESIELKFAQRGQEPSGRLKVSMSLPGTPFVPLLKYFMNRFPAIELDLDFNDCVVDVIEGGYDVAIRAGQGADSRLVSKYLGSYRLIIVGKPSYFAAAGMPDEPEDLLDHVCMHHKCPSTGKLQPWPLIAESGTFGVPVAAVASNLEPLIQFVECGAGISCLPDFAVRRQLADGSLVKVLDNYMAHSDEVRALWPSSRHLAPKVRVFVDFMAEHLFGIVESDGETEVSAKSFRVMGPERLTTQ
ncbi:LysR family transcriptional regulator [Paraburkholderia sediminicola]|uniref:LysR family transcriptional regulator n=1 Tax=Paraburkholderia sediminicola TaxID=458836 RepID=UPI0038BBE975